MGQWATAGRHMALLSQEWWGDCEPKADASRGTYLQSHNSSHPNSAKSPLLRTPLIKSLSCSAGSPASQQDTHLDKPRWAPRSLVVTKPLSLFQPSPCHVHTECSALGAKPTSKTFPKTHETNPSPWLCVSPTCGRCAEKVTI